MTKEAGCREIERFLAAGEDGELAGAEQVLVDDHLQGCARCRAFAADRALIRREFGSVPWPALPAELDRKTRWVFRPNGVAKGPAAVPAWVLVALAVVTIVTGIWLAVSLADVTPETTLADLPVAGLAAVIVIVQNALMLFFAPVILRTYRIRREAERRAV